MEKIQFRHFAMAILCMAAAVVMQSMDGVSSNVKRDQTDDTRQYVKQLCRAFSLRFKEISILGRKQYAVITLEQIPLPPQIPHDGWNQAGYLTGTNWIASFIEKRQENDNKHLENILLTSDDYNGIFRSFVQNNGRLPRNIYLYTYLLPCTGCAKKIEKYVKQIIQHTVNKLGKGISNELKEMNFWVVWSSLGDMKHYENTMDIFKSMENSALPNGLKFHFLDLKNSFECRIKDK